MPERVHGEDQVPDRQRQKVDQHPEHINHLPRGNQNENGRQTQHRSKQKNRNGFLERLGRIQDNSHNQNIGQDDGHRQDDSSEEVHEYDELHAEAESTAKIPDEDQLHEVVDG